MKNRKYQVTRHGIVELYYNIEAESQEQAELLAEGLKNEDYHGIYIYTNGYGADIKETEL